eukprot:5356911-Ditylum_brightwellii.AAC.1
MKKCGRIKARVCADGRKQQKHTHHDGASSHTVSTAVILLSCVIDAKGERDATTLDVLNAFMRADMDELINMKIKVSMAELLVEIDPKMYSKYLRTERGKLVLYVRLQKVFYVTIKAALLFGENIANTLQEWGFEINPYNWCVASK